MKIFIGILISCLALYSQAEPETIATEVSVETTPASTVETQTPNDQAPANKKFARLVWDSEPAPAAATITETIMAPVVDTRPIVDQLQELKKISIELNRDLFILEEDLLFPANTQITVFLSMDVGEFFKLDTVELLIDDETVSSYLYTQQQIEALQKGGLQRFYIGNLKTGSHEISAFFIGKGPKGKDYKRAATLVFEKGTDPLPLELKIIDSTQKYQPEFSIVKWDVSE